MQPLLQQLSPSIGEQSPSKVRRVTQQTLPYYEVIKSIGPIVERLLTMGLVGEGIRSAYVHSLMERTTSFCSVSTTEIAHTLRVIIGHIVQYSHALFPTQPLATVNIVLPLSCSLEIAIETIDQLIKGYIAQIQQEIKQGFGEQMPLVNGAGHRFALISKTEGALPAYITKVAAFFETHSGLIIYVADDLSPSDSSPS